MIPKIKLDVNISVDLDTANNSMVKSPENDNVPV